MYIVVAALAASLIAISKAEGHAIVACRDHSLVLCDDSAIAPLHAVGTRGGQFSQSHEVCVEGGTHQLGVLEVNLGEGVAEVKNVFRFVLEATLYQGLLLAHGLVEGEFVAVEVNLVVDVNELLKGQALHLMVVLA